MCNWQPVSTAPDDNRFKLVWGAHYRAPQALDVYKAVYGTSFRDDRRLWFSDSGIELVGVTHWMPLPEPPTQE